MAAPTLCLFNKFGFCKYNETCRKHHVNEKCNNKTCDISKCRLRHPKLCKFYRNYGYCKFSPCAFKHEQVLLPEESKEIENKVKAVSEKMIALENEIKEKDVQIAELSGRIFELENNNTDHQIETVDPIPNEKDCKIDTLEKAHKEFEKKLEQYEKNMITFAKHMKGVCDHVDDLAVELNDTLGDITVESEDNLMEKTFNNPSVGFDCEFCDFIAKTERGLKTHKTRKHCSCEWCDYICKDESDMKKHKFDKHTLQYGTELLKDCYL